MNDDMKDYEDLIQLGQIANLEEEVENLKEQNAKKQGKSYQKKESKSNKILTATMWIEFIGLLLMIIAGVVIFARL